MHDFLILFFRNITEWRFFPFEDYKVNEHDVDCKSSMDDGIRINYPKICLIQCLKYILQSVNGSFRLKNTQSIQLSKKVLFDLPRIVSVVRQAFFRNLHASLQHFRRRQHQGYWIGRQPLIVQLLRFSNSFWVFFICCLFCQIGAFK